MFLQLAGPRVRAAALAPEIKQLDAACRIRSLTYLRDRALKMLGYAGALHQAELVTAARKDVTFSAEDLQLQTPTQQDRHHGAGGRARHPVQSEDRDLPGASAGSLT